MAVVRVDPLKVIAEIPGEDGAVDRGRPAGASCTSTRYPDRTIRRQGVAHQPCGQHARRARSRSRRSCPNQDARAQAGHLRARQRRERQGRSGADAAVRGAAVPLRRQSRVRGRRRQAVVARSWKVGERLGDRIEIVSGVERRRTAWRSTDVDEAGRRSLKVSAGAGRKRNSMLSELCVRRPVFATMLVMSLVVARDLLVPRPRRRPVPARRSGDGERGAVAARRQP